jgi:hypothetical protein
MKTDKNKVDGIRDMIWNIINDNTEEKSFGCVNCDIDETHLIFKDDNSTLFLNDIINYIQKKLLSPYNISHNEISDCCGCFTLVDDYGIIRCNECGNSLHESILLKAVSQLPAVTDKDIEKWAKGIHNQDFSCSENEIAHYAAIIGAKAHRDGLIPKK